LGIYQKLSVSVENKTESNILVNDHNDQSD